MWAEGLTILSIKVNLFFGARTAVEGGGCLLCFSVAILLGRNAYLEAEKASEMRLILEAHRGGNLLDALAAVAKHKFRRTYDFIAYQLVCRTPRKAFAYAGKVLGRDAEKGNQKGRLDHKHL